MSNVLSLRSIACMLMGILFAMLCILPATAVRMDHSFDFRGVEMQATDAEFHYAARVQEIRDGFWKTANVFYVGDKSQPYLQPPLPEMVVAGIGSVFGLDAARSIIVSQFLFGIGVFLIMVGCFAEITGKFWWSFIGVTVMLCAGFLFSDPTLAWKLFRETPRLEFLTFARPVNPQWSATLFFGALWTLALWMKSASKKALLGTALLTVLSVYSYVYSWTLLGAIYACVGVWYIVRRDWQKVRDLSYLLVGIVLGSLPYLWNLRHSINHLFYRETSLRFGLIESHGPVFGVYLGVFLLVAWLGRKTFGRHAPLIWSFALASIIVQNQQLITGTSIVLSHYHWYFVKPTAIILALVLIGSWGWTFMPRALVSKACSIALMVIGCLGALALGGLYQWRSYQAARPFWQEQQKAAGTLTYMNQHLRPGDVVYAQGFIRDLIPVYTSADVYTAINAFAYLSSDRRARDAYFFDVWLQGVSFEEAASTFPTTRRGELSSHIHGIHAREAHGSWAAIPDAEVEEHLQAYKIFTALSEKEKRALYPLDYVIISSSDRATPALAALREKSQSVYDDQAFEIRKLQKSE